MWCARLRCSENFHPARLKPQVCHFFMNRAPSPGRSALILGTKAAALCIYTQHMSCWAVRHGNGSVLRFENAFLCILPLSATHISLHRVCILQSLHTTQAERETFTKLRREKKNTHTELWRNRHVRNECCGERKSNVCLLPIMRRMLQKPLLKLRYAIPWILEGI